MKVRNGMIEPKSIWKTIRVGRVVKKMDRTHNEKQFVEIKQTTAIGGKIEGKAAKEEVDQKSIYEINRIGDTVKKRRL